MTYNIGHASCMLLQRLRGRMVIHATTAAAVCRFRSESEAGPTKKKNQGVGKGPTGRIKARKQKRTNKQQQI